MMAMFDHNDIKVVTFGSPGVGDGAFADQFNQAIKHSTCHHKERSCCEAASSHDARQLHSLSALCEGCIDPFRRPLRLTEVLYVNALIILGDASVRK
jgi:hypothetical protein